jgi:hypothetical protein
MPSEGLIDYRDLQPDPRIPGDAIVCKGLAAAGMAAKELMPENCGFIIVAVPFGLPPEHAVARYAANVNREDAVAILKALLFRWGINDEWMAQAK